MNQTIAIFNFKGGVGKTTTTFNLANSWAMEMNVLVIDCDPQCNLSNTFLSNPETQENIVNYIKGYLHNNIREINPIEIKKGLHIIPGDPKIAELESNNQFIEFGEVIVQRLFQKIKDEYDLVILDCPTFFGKTVQYIINSVDCLLIPASPDTYSLKGALKLVDYLRNSKRSKPIRILGMFFNRYRHRLVYHRKVKALAKKIFGPLILEETVRNSIRVSETTDRRFVGSPINEESEIANDFYRLSEMLKQKLTPVIQKDQSKFRNLSSGSIPRIASLN